MASNSRGYRECNHEVSGRMMSGEGVDELLASITVTFRWSTIAWGCGIFALFKCAETQGFLWTCVWS